MTVESTKDEGNLIICQPGATLLFEVYTSEKECIAM
jgi:hypothetical protein